MTFNEKISINGIGGHINTNPKKSYKTKVVKSLFTGKTYQSPNTKIMTPSELIQLLEVNNIATDIESLCRALCDRYEKLEISRNKCNWHTSLITELGTSCQGGAAFGIKQSLLNLAIELLENGRTIEDFKDNYKLNQ